MESEIEKLSDELIKSWTNGNKITVMKEILNLENTFHRLYFAAKLQKEFGDEFLQYLESYYL